jgi:serine/threonine protein kinase HipA of HipAB toxin-antitoxin module
LGVDLDDKSLQIMSLAHEIPELLHRLTVNDMLGNYDAHARNFGVIYPDGHTPVLSPA